MSNTFDPEKSNTDWQNDEIILGVDEAGRGPAIGPLVYACAYWKEDYNKPIKDKFKFNDSKQIKEEDRSKMFKQINDHPNLIGYQTVIVTPQDISLNMLSREKVSLNTLSYNAAFETIKKALDSKINISKIYVDTIGNPKKYQSFILKKLHCYGFNKKIDVIVETKADAKYTVVGAASICAKVTRDSIINQINSENLGSGYPSDPNTVKWLQNNFNEVFGYQDYIRFSWKTIGNIFKEKKCDAEWENYNEEEEIEKQKNKYKQKKNEEIDENQTIINFNKENFINNEKPNISDSQKIKTLEERYNINFYSDI